VLTLRIACGLLCAVVLFGQQGRRFSWQEYCFTNPAAITCPGHEYFKKGPKGTSAPGTPGVMSPAGIDWHFADPASDALAGFNPASLAAAPLARKAIVQLGAKHGLTEADVQKMFDGLAGVDDVALSIHGDRIVAMLTGQVKGFALPAQAEGLKAVSVSPDAMLVGNADAVDQAMQRIAKGGPPSELMRSAEERQAGNDFWATATAGFVDQQAENVGMRRITLTVSTRNRVTGELALEFNEVPSAATLRTWLPTLGAVMIDSNTVHLRMSMDEIASSPVGPRLSALADAARYLPAPGPSAPNQQAATK